MSLQMEIIPKKRFIFILKFYLCMSVAVYAMCVWVGTHGSQGRVLEPQELELTGQYEPPKVSAEV